MHVDDELGLFEAAAETGILFPQALVFVRQRIGCGFSPALLRSQRIEFTLLLLRRQVVRWDEYNPSRRSKAPMAPSSRQASAWATIERLYSAVNWRRLAFSGTSGSGIGTGAAPPESEAKRLALFLKTRNVGVLLDEAHKIKNPDSALTKVFFSLGRGFKRRLIMTGTPVANRPYDLWAQIKFLDGGARTIMMGWDGR